MAGADPGLDLSDGRAPVPRPRRDARRGRLRRPSRRSPCGPPGSASGCGPRRARARRRGAPRPAACRAGPSSSTPGPGSCSARPPSSPAAVEGGVVAYQVAFVVFLAPYGIVAQPIHTAVLPRLVRRRGGRATATASAQADALGAPMARRVDGPRGRRDGGPGPADHAGARLRRSRSAATSVELLAAALVGLALGLPAYGAFLLLARAWYALGDSRTPALAALGSARGRRGRHGGGRPRRRRHRPPRRHRRRPQRRLRPRGGVAGVAPAAASSGAS